jgi:hypothetical protein
VYRQEQLLSPVPAHTGANAVFNTAEIEKNPKLSDQMPAG